jgi:hypothetical protein
MKRIVFLYIIAGALVFASCSEDDPTPSTVKYVTINLQIGGDSTLSLSGGSTPFAYNNGEKEFIKGKTLISTRAIINGVTVPDFVPKVPNTFTAYFVANENTTKYPTAKDNAQVIDSVTVHTGNNYITVPAMKYKVFVTNYSNGNEMNYPGWSNWYTYPDALGQLPAGCTTLYLYGKNENMDFTNGAVGEIQMTNPYAAVCVYNNNYILQPPYDNNGHTDFVLSGQWYYCYIRSLSSTTTTNIAINRSTNYKGIREQISPNNIYQYIIDDN